ncbi:hypothetical protein OH77DRAFT_1404967 [Trametes cingulata]|nr:hypothetical protein OH77DRAFT_1404967 [Trametes cingulata]
MADSTTSYFPLLRLPEELRVEILSYLDVKDLLHCRQVCTRLKETIRESLQLQYNIELVADGLVEGVGCTLPLAERYNLLLERRRRWRALDWTQVTPIPAPALCQAYELVDGVFASSMVTLESELFGGSRHLSITRLPTCSEPARTIERDNLEFPVRDFAIDPSQDLVALVLADASIDDAPAHIVVRLHTISENKPHPKAAVTQLEIPIPFEAQNSFIQIVDDVVGMFFWMHGPALVIWNWRTGRVMVKQLGFDTPAGTYDFAFLSSRAYMITVTAGSGSIHIYTFSDPDSSLPPTQPQPISLSSPRSAEPSSPTRVAILRLPTVKIGQDVRRFQTHSGPFVARPTPGRAFETAPDCRLHVMEVTYGDQATRYNIFVRNCCLLSYVPPGVGSGDKDYQPIVKEWDEWGPDNTRFFTIMGRFQWLRCTHLHVGRYVHGERVILPEVPHLGGAPAQSRRTRTMILLDFNVHPKRVDDPVSPAGVTDTAYRALDLEDQVVEAGPVFESPVVTRLPFAMTTRLRPQVGEDYSGFMIDQEHLLGMRVRENSRVTAHHVLGESTVTLGAGDLNIIPIAGGKDLTLSVGGAAFALKKGTDFGTLENDPRAYVFSPEIEGVHGGYVKLTLPEGVTEDGSRLSELQTRFEEVLIEHGFLQPAEEASARQRIKDAIHSPTTEPLVSIPGVIAAQVVGEETSVLSEGTLSLVVIPKSEKHVEGQGGEPLLTLTVGKATFPLFVGVVLPESIEQPGVDLAELQNHFELALIEYGLLKDGFEAAADEVSRSVREDSARTAQRIREAKEFYLKTHPRTIDPAEFPKAAHSVAHTSVAGTQTLANAAHWVSGAVTSAASSAGAWIASTFVPTEPAATEQLTSAARGVSTAVQGVAEGTKEVKDTLKDAAGAVVENDYGEEAREVAGSVGQSVGNVGAVAGDVATVTSGAALAVAGLQGAAGRQNEEQREASAHNGPERAA